MIGMEQRSEQNREHKFREVIERYCSVIDGNTALFRISDAHSVTYECLNKHRCLENGGCTNDKYR